MATFKNILLPVNLDSEDFSYMKKAAELAAGFGEKTHFLYVNDEQAGYRHPTDREDDVALKVREIVPGEILGKMKTVFAVSKRDLAGEIEAYCRKENIDLLIVGHKHRGRFYNAMFDSSDINIVDKVKLPILVIPRD